MRRPAAIAGLAVCLSWSPLAAPSAQTLLAEGGGPDALAATGSALAFTRSNSVVGPVLCVGAPFSDVGGDGSGWLGFYNFAGLLFMDASGDPFDQLGSSISTSGDLDADGWADIVIGAPGGDYVQVRSGFDLKEYPWSPIHAPIPITHFGQSVAIVGDYDGDGRDDIAVGAPYDDTEGASAGAVLIFRGIDGTGWTSGGPPIGQAKENAGWAVARIADIDGDGKDDLAVGCPYYDTAGKADAGRVTFKGTAQPVSAQLEGGQADEHYGYSLAGGGDVNKDGVPDLLVGAPAWNGPFGTTHGRVEVRTGGALLAPPPLWAEHAGAVALGELGFSVAFAGDVDHDGYDDVLAGAPKADQNDGRALLWSGRTAEVLYNRRGADGEFLGRAVAGNERIDGDVYDDWVVGRPRADFPSGAEAGGFSIFSGKNHWFIPGPSGFGHSVAVVGDTDGDAFDDFLVGTYGGDPPLVRWTLVSGFDSQTLHEQLAAAGCEGFSVAGFGDADGDALADLLVGNPCGVVDAVVLRSGADATPLKTFASPDLSAVRFGHAVAGVGDVDGDGVPDVLVGDPEHGPAAAFEAGAAWLFSGAPPYALLAEHHGAAGDRLGHSVAAAGDVDLDGFPDYAAGAPFQDDLFSEEGGARVWSYANGLLYAVGNTAAGNSHAGWSVAGVGDGNADGHAEVAVGEPDWQGAIAAKLGRVRVYAGPAGAVHLTLDGPFPGSRFGWAVAPGGDMDADGRDDLAVGIPADLVAGGRVQILSGADGSLVQHASAPFAQSDFGSSVAGRVERGVDFRFEVIAGAPHGDVFHEAYVKVLLAPFYATAPTGDTCTDDTTSGAYGLDMSPPFLGEIAHVTVTDPPHPINALVLGAPLATPLLVGGCEVYVSPFAPYALVPAVATKTFTVELLVPDEPAFAGLTLAAQAFSLNKGLHATHGLHFTLGY